MPCSIFKQLSERHCHFEIALCAWNSKFDLLALTSTKGNVCLQRIFWKKAWDFPNPYQETVLITGICWSPRGDCLCVSYSNSTLHFLEIESGKSIYQFNLPGLSNSKVELLKWFRSPGLAECPTFNNKDDNRLNMFDLIPEAKPVEKTISTSSVTKTNRQVPTFASIFLCSEYKDYCTMLCVGLKQEILIYLNGLLLLYSIKLPSNSDLIDLNFSDNWRSICLIYKQPTESGHSIKSMLFDSTKLVTDLPQMIHFIDRISKLFDNMQMMKTILKSIGDSWEDVFGDIGEKFAKFAKQIALMDANASIGDEFIYVLAFGSASPELLSFVCHDINERNLKKLTQSLNSTYGSIRRLVACDLIASLSRIYYHLTNMRNFSGFCSRLNLLDAKMLEMAALGCETAILKCQELLNVLDATLDDLHLFFVWLGKLSATLSSEENTPPLQQSSSSSMKSSSANASKALSREDHSRILNFIKSVFLVPYDERDAKAMFSFEKVGQYLRDADLKMKYVDRTLLDFDCSWNKDKSLIQLINGLNSGIDKLIDAVNINAENEKLICPKNYPSIISHVCDSNLKLLLKPTSNDCFLVFLVDSDMENTIRVDLINKNGEIQKAWSVVASRLNRFKLLVDYDQSSVLAFLENEQRSASKSSNEEKCRLTVARICDQVFSALTGDSEIRLESNEFIQTQLISGGPYGKLCVSSARKIACLLYSCQTRLKILEMEPDEESLLNGTGVLQEISFTE